MGMLLGLVKPTMGSFSLFGGSTSHQDALHRTGVVVETPSFYPYLSGRDNLAYFQGITERVNRRELDDLLGEVGMYAAELASGVSLSMWAVFERVNVDDSLGLGEGNGCTNEAIPREQTGTPSGHQAPGTGAGDEADPGTPEARAPWQ